MKQRINLAAPDSGLLGAIILLIAVGIVLVFDASYSMLGDKGKSCWSLVLRQGISVCVGLVGMFIATKVPFRLLRKWLEPIVILSFLLLLTVHIPGLGSESGGARSWLKLGPLSFQPSEIVKVAVVALLAAGLSRPGVFVRRPEAWVVPLVVASGLIGLIVLEPDLGTASVVVGTCVFMFIAAGAKKRFILLSVVAILLCGMFVMTHVHHCKVRWNAFTNPWADPYDGGFQTVHSLLALGTGGVTGQWLGEGREKLYLPEAESDYIFSATVGEELGLVGTIGMLGLFGFVVYRGLDIARRCKSTYGNLLAVGLTTMIGLQALINIAVVTNSIPATGIPLPFISYGGSSLVSMMVAAGLLLSVSRQVNVELD